MFPLLTLTHILYNTHTIQQGNLYGNPGGSGGFAEMIFREVARERWGKEVEKVEFVNKRNQDMKVFVLFCFVLVLLCFCFVFVFFFFFSLTHLFA